MEITTAAANDTYYIPQEFFVFNRDYLYADVDSIAHELTEEPADDVIGSSSKSTQGPKPDVCPLDNTCSTQDIRESCDSTDEAIVIDTTRHIEHLQSEPWVQCLLNVV